MPFPPMTLILPPLTPKEIRFQTQPIQIPQPHAGKSHRQRCRLQISRRQFQEPLSNSSAFPSPPPINNNQPVFVDDENMPLEGAIQFDKPSSSARIRKLGSATCN